MDVLTVLSWVVLGFIAGYIVDLIDPSAVRGRLMATTITGVVGALLGGLLSTAIFGIGVTGLDLTSVIIAVVGAFILTFIQKAVSRRA